MAYKDKAREREYNREYWAKNKERISKTRKKRGSQTEYVREWREKNRERYNAYHREYRRRRKEAQKQIDNE